MKIAVVDDLKIDRQLIINKINKYMIDKELQFKLYEFENAEQFLAQFSPNTFNIIFMDIYMDKIN